MFDIYDIKLPNVFGITSVYKGRDEITKRKVDGIKEERAITSYLLKDFAPWNFLFISCFINFSLTLAYQTLSHLKLKAKYVLCRTSLSLQPLLPSQWNHSSSSSSLSMAPQSPASPAPPLPVTTLTANLQAPVSYPPSPYFTPIASVKNVSILLSCFFLLSVCFPGSSNPSNCSQSWAPYFLIHTFHRLKITQ